MSEPDSPILSIRGLNTHIGSSHILFDIDLDIAAGRTTVVLGRNGVGKTTLLHSILGYLPSTGSVRFLGEPLDGEPTFRRIRRGICYVPEDRDVFAGLTVAENLRLAEPARGEARYDLVFELFPDLKNRLNQAASSLSGGQQQMLALGRGLLPDSRLLIVDEPTKGLAPRIVKEVVAVLKRVAESTTILMVEQNLEAAHRVADEVVILGEGRVLSTGNTDLLADRERLRSYLGVAKSHGSSESGA